MEMTHYMELLATNQPWNLIIYMAIPVILAETLAISELYLLFKNTTSGRVRQLSKIAGIVAGMYFTGIFVYLFATAVVPLTNTAGWRGVADVVAVWMYLLGVVPLAGIALLELRLIYKKAEIQKRRMVHAFFIGMFLVVAHVAMIFGMLNPTLMGWSNTAKNTEHSHTQSSIGDMPMDDMMDSHTIHHTER